MATEEKPKIPLPKDWTGNVRSAVLHVIGLAQFATAYTRSWAGNSPNERMRLKAENDRLEAEVAQLKEEIRIKDARMLRLDSRKRPQYPPDRADGDPGITRCTELVKKGNGRCLPSHSSDHLRMDVPIG